VRILGAAALAVTGALLGGCFNNSSGGPGLPGPTNPESGNGAPNGGTAAPMRALYNVSLGLLPYPIDLYFAGSDDGTLRLPPTLLQLSSGQLNSLDGFSTTAPITVRFTSAIDSKTLSPADVVVIKLTLNNSNKAPLLPPAPGAQLPQALTYGKDYTVYVTGSAPPAAFAEATDDGGTTLVIEPNVPLVPSSGGTNIGYLVLLLNGIKDQTGTVAVPDTDYATVQSAALADLAAGLPAPKCASVTDSTLNQICQLTFAQLAIASAFHLDPTKVVVSFSFSTESTADTLTALAQIHALTPVAPGTIVLAPTGLKTSTLNAALPGIADVWAGTLTLPYYLTPAANNHDPAPLTKFWTAAGPSPAPGIDPASRVLTRFNPVPAQTSLQTVPVIAGVPNAGSACVEPNAGWPVVVFFHGVTRNRTDAVAVMDAYASKCFVVVAIDHPLHGLTDPTNPFYRNQLFAGSPAAGLMTGERTFDLDLENNTTMAPGPDGKIDDSGSHYINLTSLLSSRDNTRQSESDILWLGHVVPTLSLGVNINGSSDVDASKVQYLGQSLGAVTGIPALAMPTMAVPYLSGMLSMAGGNVAYLLRDSATFGPIINAGYLAANPLLHPGSTLYDNLGRDNQTILDAADPVNYVASAATNRPLLLQQVIGGAPLPNGTANLPDQVIPNSATARLLAATASTLRLTRPAAPPELVPLAPGTLPYIDFVYGAHGSILGQVINPPVTGPTDMATTGEMQGEAVSFAVAQGLATELGANPLTSFVIAP
jgi:Bacterial virulence factor lipase N-terminal